MRRSRAPPSLVPCYWHQHQLYCGKYLVEQRARGLRVGWLISPSVDGELGAMMVRRFGAAVIRGSSTHTGARALRDYYQALVKDKISPVITPGRSARAALQVQARRAAAGADVRPADPADGLRGLARLAHQVGQVRDPDAVLAHRDRHRTAASTSRGSPMPPRSSGLQRQMEQELKRLYGVARAAERERCARAAGRRQGFC